MPEMPPAGPSNQHPRTHGRSPEAQGQISQRREGAYPLPDTKIVMGKDKQDESLAFLAEMRDKCQTKVAEARRQLNIAKEESQSSLRPADSAILSCLGELVDLFQLTYGIKK